MSVSIVKNVLPTILGENVLKKNLRIVFQSSKNKFRFN